MKVKTGAAPIGPLSAELRTILLEGPWAVGKEQRDLPRHDELRAIWAVHGAALAASLPRGRRAWFVERDAFVRMVRGE